MRDVEVLPTGDPIIKRRNREGSSLATTVQGQYSDRILHSIATADIIPEDTGGGCGQAREK